MATTRRWGYVVWGLGAGVVLVPECIAAFASNWMPFTTISTMTAHLEREVYAVRLVVVALLVWLISSSTPGWGLGAAEGGGAAPLPGPTLDRDATAGRPRPIRTAGGRVVLRARAGRAPRPRNPGFRDGWSRRLIVPNGQIAPPLFWLVVVAVLAVTSLATFVVQEGRHGPNWRYDVDYVLYGLTGFFWTVVPSLGAFVWAKDAPFPTLFRTISNLEAWLNTRTWRHSIGQELAWVISYAILTGLVILLLHLIFYPFPDLTF